MTVVRQYECEYRVVIVRDSPIVFVCHTHGHGHVIQVCGITRVTTPPPFPVLPAHLAIMPLSTACTACVDVRNSYSKTGWI